jgi:HEAT repeat protein
MMALVRKSLLLALIASSGVASTGCKDSRKIDYSVPTLVKSLKDPDPNTRYYAAKSLGGFGAQANSAVPDLIETLKDDDPMVRMGAAYALAEIGPAAADAKPALEQAVKDPDAKVRDAASYTLRRLQGQRR